jgi:hypothetical protein
MLEGVNSEDKEMVTTVKGVIKAVLDGVKVWDVVSNGPSQRPQTAHLLEVSRKAVHPNECLPAVGGGRLPSHNHLILSGLEEWLSQASAALGVGEDDKAVSLYHPVAHLHRDCHTSG